jgi:hypothetical protein
MPLTDSPSALTDSRLTQPPLPSYYQLEAIMQATHEPRKLRWQDVALPSVLLLTGLVLMTFDWTGVVSLDRIQNFWPVAFILTGLVELAPADIETRS